MLSTLLASTSNSVAVSTLTLGSALAIVCSWERNRSILWAILASIFSWLYVLYFAITRRDQERKRDLP
jgi:hypothetical protein